MTLLRDLLAGRDKVVSVPPTATVREAARAMSNAQIGSVVVMEDDQMVGIFTERDLLNRVLARDLDVDEVPVSDVMSSELVTGTPEDSIGTATRLMRQHHIRHLPVVAEDKCLGVLSIRDLIREDLQGMKDYIAQREG